METELFEIRLNEQGKRIFQRINFWTKFFYICTIITCVFDFINGFLGFRAYMRFSDRFLPIVKFQYLFNIFFLIAYAIMLPLQAWFFYRFSVRSNRALQYGSSEEFNDSFHWLLKHAALASILFTLNSLWAMIITFTEIRLNALYNR